MTNFKIKFDYNGVEHTGNVHKVPFVDNLPVQYHVRNILPVIKDMPDTFMLIHEGHDKGFTWSITSDPAIPELIYTAIADYCQQHEIPLTS